MNERSAIAHIRRHGCLLVYPIDNRKVPLSLWHCFFPKSQMRWEWDSDGDNRVAELWHLREELSRSGKVVYAKWYGNRATFFSKEIFTALLSGFMATGKHHTGLMEEAREALCRLEESSPLSTKELKAACGLQGKFFESTYTRALKQLWDRLLIVGWGEREDGAFPSLLMGATRHLFEDLFFAAQSVSAQTRHQTLRSLQAPWMKYYNKCLSRLGEQKSMPTPQGRGLPGH